MRIGRKWGLIAGLAIVLPRVLWGQMRIGYIDFNRIMREFEEVQEAQAQLARQTRRVELEYQSHVDRLDSLRQELERQRLLMSSEIIKSKEDEIRQQYLNIQGFQQRYLGPEGDISRTEAQLMSGIWKKIETATDKIGDEKKYDFILVRSSMGSGPIFANPDHDLTSHVLAELRRSGANGKANE